MRILLLCDKPPWPGNSGGAIATSSVIDAMLSNGFDVTVFFLSTPKHNLSSDDTPIAENRQLKLASQRIDNRIKPINALMNLLLSRKPYNIERFFSEKAAGRISTLLKENSYDIIQFEGLIMNLYFRQVKRESDALLVMRSHNVESDIWFSLADETRQPLRKFYYHSLAKRIAAVEKKYLNCYDRLLAISENDRKRFVNAGVTIPVKTLYPAINDGTTGVIKTMNDTFTAGFIGSLDWNPNINGLRWFLERVWPELKNTNPGIEVKVAGRNPNSATIKRIKRAGVEYCGSPESSESFLESVNLLIVPLFSGSGIRIKIIEALIHGVPVVTTARGAEGLPHEITTIITITDDPAEMSEKIREMAENRDSLQDSLLLKNSAEKYFSEKAVEKEVTKIYTELKGG